MLLKLSAKDQCQPISNAKRAVEGHEQNVNAIVEKLLQQKVLQHRKRRTSQKALSYFYKKGKIQALCVAPV